LRVSWYKKGIDIGVIFLFIGMSITPSTGINLVKQSTKATLDGNILYVGGSEPGNYTKIQDAIDNTSDGDTVFVYDDSSPYYENVVIDKSINLIGENQETTVIDGGASSYVIRITASSVQVSDFNIRNCENWKSNIYMDGVHDCLITDNIVIGNEFGLIDGIEIEYSNNNTIRNNNITNFYQSGIHLYVSTHNTIENNAVTSCHYRGILIHYYSNDNYITNNSCIETGTGIELHTNCEENNVYENTVLDSRGGGIFLHKVGGNDVYINYVLNNSFGIGTQYSHDNEIYSNILTNNGKGVYFQHDSYDNNIFENYIGDNEIGVRTYQSTSNNILSNIIVNNQKGIFIDSLTNNYYIFENNISDNNIGIELSATTQNNISKNLMTNIESSILLGESYDNMIFQNTIQESLNGIKSLHSSSNYIIENTFLDNYDSGICLSEGSNLNFLFSNHFENNKNYGVKAEFSLQDDINRNSFVKNKCGIILTNCSSNTITDYTISNNRGGIRLRDSNYSTISGNSFFNNGLFVHDSYHNAVENNMVNGKPLVYLEGELDKIIADAGQIILVNCDNITAENLSLSNTDVGIELWKTNNSKIWNNDCSNNRYGLYLHTSSDNNITGNTINSNNYRGIHLDYSNSNIIYHNNFIDNGENAYDNRKNTWNDSKYGNYWSDYKEKYPFARKLWRLGIWNTPYDISGGNNKDMCPLIKQWPNSKLRTISRITASYISYSLRFLECFPLLEKILLFLTI